MTVNCKVPNHSKLASVFVCLFVCLFLLSTPVSLPYGDAGRRKQGYPKAGDDGRVQYIEKKMLWQDLLVVHRTLLPQFHRSKQCFEPLGQVHALGGQDKDVWEEYKGWAG